MNLRREVSNQFANTGWRRSGRRLSRAIDSEWSYWIDTGPLALREDVAPFVGLRSVTIETLLADCMNLPADEWGSTTGGNVGYVLGIGYKWWEPPYSVDEVIIAIRRALDILTPYASLDHISDMWLKTWTHDPWWLYRKMIVCHLRGETAQARTQLEEAQPIFCERNGELCEQYRSFAVRFTSMLQGGKNGTLI